MRRTYKQLTATEEQKLFRRWRRHKDRDAYALLVESQMAWARKLAADYCNHKKWDDWEIAESAAYEGVVEAVAKFDPKRGTRLTTLSYWYIHKCIRKVYRERFVVRSPQRGKYPAHTDQARRQMHSFSDERTDAPISRDQDVPAALARDDWQELLRGRVGVVLADLKPREAEIIRRCAMEGETLKSVGDSLGISKERVRQIKARLLPQIARRLFDEGTLQHGQTG
jgi:RNA polymerase sigma factor (sigma-70 family)